MVGSEGLTPTAAVPPPAGGEEPPPAAVHSPAARHCPSAPQVYVAVGDVSWSTRRCPAIAAANPRMHCATQVAPVVDVAHRGTLGATREGEPTGLSMHGAISRHCLPCVGRAERAAASAGAADGTYRSQRREGSADRGARERCPAGRDERGHHRRTLPAAAARNSSDARVRHLWRAAGSGQLVRLGLEA